MAVRFKVGDPIRLKMDKEYKGMVLKEVLATGPPKYECRIFRPRSIGRVPFTLSEESEIINLLPEEIELIEPRVEEPKVTDTTRKSLENIREYMQGQVMAAQELQKMMKDGEIPEQKFEGYKAPNNIWTSTLGNYTYPRDKVEREKSMYERFTDRARKAIQFANMEAQRFNHEYIGTEHLLLGLVKEGSGVAANVLKNLDVVLPKIRLGVERLIRSGPDMVTMGKLPQTPLVKRIIEYSIEEARSLNHNYVGTEHLLLGMIRVGEGVAAKVLTDLGLTIELIREEILNLVGPMKGR